MKLLFERDSKFFAVDFFFHLTLIVQMTESTPTADNSNIQPHPSSLTSSSNTPKQEIQETPKRERTMAEFLALMDNYAPIVNAKRKHIDNII